MTSQPHSDGNARRESRRESHGDSPLLHVDRHGQSGSPILLIHGFAASVFEFRLWVSGLAERHRVWAVDLKGHGSSPVPSDDRYSPHDHAEAVHRLIVQEDLRDLTLVGHSMGGGIALLVALRLLAEGRLERLILVSSAAYPQPIPGFITLAQRRRVTRWILALIPKAPLVRLVLRAIVYDRTTVTAAQVEGYAAQLRSKHHRLAIIHTALQILPENLAEMTARYPEIDVPTLLLWGRHDRVVPLSVGEKLLDVLPRARLEVLEECGHLVPEELPEESLEIVLDFLSVH